MLIQNKMTKKEREELILEIDQLDDTKVHYVNIDGLLYKILILGRGEMMYFSKEGKSTLIEISARFSKLYLNSFKSWGNGKAILESERSDLAAIIKKVYLLAYKEDLEIVH